MGGVQGGHQLKEGLSVGSGNGGHGRALLLLSGLLEDEGDDGVGGALHHANDGVVDGILVLEEPASDVVADGTGVVVKGKVSLGHSLLGRLGLGEGVVLAQVLVHHLLQVGLVGGLGDDALFLQHGQDAHLLLDQLDGLDQIHTEVDEGPLDALSLVLLLLLDEHVVVEELLQALISVVNEKLLQDVEIENLEAGNVQDTDEVFSGIGSSRESLTLATIQSKRRAKRDLEVAETEKATWSTFCPFFTKSLPTFNLGFMKVSTKNSGSTPIRAAQAVTSSMPSGSACSSRPFCLHLAFPRWAMAMVAL